ELLEEVGRDAARFTFLTRRHDSPLEFDLALATRQSADTPVYYVQHAHARTRSILRQAASQGAVPAPEWERRAWSPRHPARRGGRRGSGVAAASGAAPSPSS